MAYRSAATQDLATSLATPIQSIRQRRKFIEYEWLKNYAAWQGWPNAQFYTSLADDSVRYFIPAARRAIERIVVRVVKLLTPKTKWFEVQPFDAMSHPKAESVDAYMRFLLRSKIPFRRNLSSLTRAGLLYTFSVLNTAVGVDPQGDVWPTQRSVDPFCFYVFPETATSRDDALLLFEDTIIPYEVYRSFSDADLCSPIDPAQCSNPEWPYHLIERYAYRGLTNPSDFPYGLASGGYEERKAETRNALNTRASAFVELTNMWVRRGNAWFNGWLVWNLNPNASRTVRGSQTEYRQQSSYQPTLVKFDASPTGPMYRWSTFRPLPNELYTNGLMDDVRVLQILFNNQISQTEEARSMATTGPVAMNDQLINRAQQYRWANRQIWHMNGDVREAFARVPWNDTSTTGIRAAQITLGLIDRLAGAGTIAEGQPGRNMPRSGFAVNNLLNLSLSDTQDFAEFLEADVTTPSLSDIHAMTMQFVPETQIIKIPGAQGMLPLEQTTGDLAGQFAYEWIGNLEFQDREVRAERLMAFLKLVVEGLPVLQQFGYTINLPALVQTIWADGLGERQITQMIQPLPQPPPGMGPPGTAPGAPPGAPGAEPPGAPAPGQPPEAAGLPGMGGGMSPGFEEILNQIRSLPEQV